jgi:hypothetical protein
LRREAPTIHAAPAGDRLSLQPHSFSHGPPPKATPGRVDAYRDLWDARLDRFGKALEAKRRARKKQGSGDVTNTLAPLGV